MPECPNCGCDPTPAEKHRSIQFCYEALKTALAQLREKLYQTEKAWTADVDSLRLELAHAKDDIAELTKKVPGPLRPKKGGIGG